MYVRGSTLVGMPILASDTQESIETVKAMLLGHHDHRLVGFVVDRGGWKGSARLVLWNNATLNLKAHTITVDSADSILSAGATPAVRKLFEAHPLYPTLEAVKVKTADQRLIGRLSDIYLDPQTGKINSYEISHGFTTLGERVAMLAQGLTLQYKQGILLIQPSKGHAPSKGSRDDIESRSDSRQSPGFWGSPLYAFT